LPDGGSLSFSAALGHGTNNLGEVWAIGLGLSKASALPAPRPTEIHVFSDSEFAIGVANKGWYSRDFHPLASAIRAATRGLSAPVYYHKVAGHADIPLNEAADAAAKRGALASKALSVPRGAAERTAAFSSDGFGAFAF
jgi:ribonuclease HI